MYFLRGAGRAMLRVFEQLPEEYAHKELVAEAKRGRRKKWIMPESQAAGVRRFIKCRFSHSGVRSENLSGTYGSGGNWGDDKIFCVKLARRKGWLAAQRKKK